LGGVSTAATILVPTDQPTIQCGIDASAPGDTVLVLSGSYQEFGIRMKSGVHLRGEGETWIRSDVQLHTRADALICDGVDASATIDGIAFDGANLEPEEYRAAIRCLSSNVVIRNCTFVSWDGPPLHLTDSSPRIESTSVQYCGALSMNGGGVYAIDSSPTISGCTFVSNVAAHGGGIWCGGNTAALIEASTFDSCNAVASGGSIFCEGTTKVLNCDIRNSLGSLGDQLHGGGIACAGEVTIQGCRIERTGQKGTVRQGGGIHVGSGSVTISDCRITSCAAEIGGAIYFETGTHSISDCQMDVNEADEGGGVAVMGGNTHIERTLIMDNRACRGGGGVHVDHASTSLVRCTIIDNLSPPGSGVMAVNSQVELRQSILRYSCDTKPDLVSSAGSTVAVESCNIDPSRTIEDSGTILWGVCNSTEPPCFCTRLQCQVSDWMEEDFRLMDGSPCLPENNDCGVHIGALDVGCPTTHLEPRSWGLIKAEHRTPD
jgi:hypothetical protein